MHRIEESYCSYAQVVRQMTASNSIRKLEEDDLDRGSYSDSFAQHVTEEFFDKQADIRLVEFYKFVAQFCHIHQPGTDPAALKPGPRPLKNRQ